MTEIFEVELFKDDLLNIKELIDYESQTQPGETQEVKNLFLKSSKRILQAANLLKQAEVLMKKDHFDELSRAGN